MAAEIGYEQRNQITLNGQEKIILRSYEIDTPVKPPLVDVLLSMSTADKNAM
jgi:hypothetical protein